MDKKKASDYLPDYINDGSKFSAFLKRINPGQVSKNDTGAGFGSNQPLDDLRIKLTEYLDIPVIIKGWNVEPLGELASNGMIGPNADMVVIKLNNGKEITTFSKVVAKQLSELSEFYHARQFVPGVRAIFRSIPVGQGRRKHSIEITGQEGEAE